MKVKVEIKNAEKIEAILKEINGRANSHTITTFSEIEALAKVLINKVEKLGIKKSERFGAKLKHVSGGSVPKSYKYSRQVTNVTLELGKSGVYLTQVGGDHLFNSQTGETYFYLSASQMQTAVTLFQRRESIYSMGN